MKNNLVSSVLAIFFILSLACNAVTTFSTLDGPVDTFTATVTSPVSVMVRWPASPGAMKYLLEVKYGDLEFFPMAEISGDQTSFEDFPAPDDTKLTYRLQAVTSSGINEMGMASVTTPVHEPNPITVQAHDYEPVAWSPPVIDPTDPNFDPNSLYPPGFDLNDPDSFDPSSLMVFPSTTEVIGPEGGTISLTSPDNGSFTLTIPAGALDAEIPITLTPIESIDGLPLSGGLLGAVRIEPDGLQLEIPALLQISLPEGKTVPAENEMYGFAFNGDGKEFHLYPFAPEEGVSLLDQGASHLARNTVLPMMAGPLAEIAASQLGPYGVGAGTRSDARSVVQNNRPTSSQDAAANTAGYKDRAWESASQLNDEVMFETTSLPSFVLALSHFEFHLQQYGRDERSQVLNESTWRFLVFRFKLFLDRHQWKCVTRDDHYLLAIVQRMMNPPKDSFYAQLADRFKKEYGERILKDILDKAAKCKFQFFIDSLLKVEVGDGAVYYIPVSGRAFPLKVRMVDDALNISGSGKLLYGKVEARLRESNCTPLRSPKFLSDLTITKLHPLWDADGNLQDWELLNFEVVDPTGTLWEFTCTGVGGSATLTAPRMGKSIWHGYFTAAHMPDLVLRDWEVNEGPVVIWSSLSISNQAFTPAGGDGTWCEDTDMSIYRADEVEKGFEPQFLVKKNFSCE